MSEDNIDRKSSPWFIEQETEHEIKKVPIAETPPPSIIAPDEVEKIAEHDVVELNNKRHALLEEYKKAEHTEEPKAVETHKHKPEPERHEREVTPTYEQICQKALAVLNQRVMGSEENGITMEILQRIQKFKLFADFRDLETGQKWTLIVDRVPPEKNRRDSNEITEGVDGIRISLFNKLSARNTESVMPETSQLGFRVYPEQILSYGQRYNDLLTEIPFKQLLGIYNHYIPHDTFKRKGAGYETDGNFIVGLLDRSLDPKKTKLGSHSPLPRTTTPNIKT